MIRFLILLVNTVINALDVINKFEPVEYEHTDNLVDQYPTDTPQSHQCGVIA